MIVICLKCFTAVLVFDEPETLYLVDSTSEFWPDKFTCVSCDSQAFGYHEPDVDASITNRLKVTSLTPYELYAAQRGLGIPAQQSCTPEVISSLLVGAQIQRVDCQPIKGTTRSIINSITLVDGTTVFLASGTHGATVYRVRPPFNYTENVSG